MPRTQTARRAPAQQQGQTSAMTVAENQDEALRRVAGYVTAKRDQLAMLLAGGVDPERFITVALAAVQGTPKLLECSPLSIFTAIREAATYGLELGPLGDASLTPYGDEAQLSVEYRGYRKLAMRDGTVRVIAADVVFAADAFRIVSGSEAPGIFHEPAPFGDRGNVIGAYAWARLANGELAHVEMSEAELYKRRDVSRSYQNAIKYGRTDSIWHLWPIEMMRKTVIKRLCSEQLPLTPLLREVITRDTDADLARAEDRTKMEPGQLQGGDARQRILAAMGLDKPAAELPATTGDAAADDVDQDEAAAAAFAAAQAAGELPAQDVQGGPSAAEPAVVLCSSASPYEDVPEPCSKPLGHRLVCANGRATWETPKGWTGA